MLSASKEESDIPDRFDSFDSNSEEEAPECNNVFPEPSKQRYKLFHALFFRAMRGKNFSLVSHIISRVRDKEIKIQVALGACQCEDIIAFGISCAERRFLYVNDENQKIICEEIKLFWKLCTSYLDDTGWDKKNEQLQAQYKSLLNLCEWIGFDSQSYLSTTPEKVIDLLKNEYKNLIEKNHLLLQLLERYLQGERDLLTNVEVFWTSFNDLSVEFDQSPLLALFKQFVKQAASHHNNVMRHRSTPLQNLAIMIGSDFADTQFTQQEQEDLKILFKELYITLEREDTLSTEIKQNISKSLDIVIKYLSFSDGDSIQTGKKILLELSAAIDCSKIPEALKNRIKKISEWTLKKSPTLNQSLSLDILKQEISPQHNVSLLHGLLNMPDNIAARKVPLIQKVEEEKKSGEEEKTDCSSIPTHKIFLHFPEEEQQQEQQEQQEEKEQYDNSLYEDAESIFNQEKEAINILLRGRLVSDDTENYIRSLLADMEIKVARQQIKMRDVREFERKMQNLPMPCKLIVAIAALIASLIVCASVIAGIVSITPLGGVSMGAAIFFSAEYSVTGLFRRRKDREQIKEALEPIISGRSILS